jgi:hypothetical protein
MVVDLGEYAGKEVYEPDWQEQRYPDLKGLSNDEQRRILYDKMACDAVISVQFGLLKTVAIFFTLFLLVPALEALLAGYLWRRYQRIWPVTVVYAERVIPLAFVLVLGMVVIWAAFELSAMGAQDWFGKLQTVFWPAEVLIVPMIVALVAAWRGWWWPIRLLLHAAWIGFFLYVVVGFIRVS